MINVRLFPPKFGRKALSSGTIRRKIKISLHSNKKSYIMEKEEKRKEMLCLHQSSRQVSFYPIFPNILLQHSSNYHSYTYNRMDHQLEKFHNELQWQRKILDQGRCRWSLEMKMHLAWRRRKVFFIIIIINFISQVSLPQAMTMYSGFKQNSV